MWYTHSGHRNYRVEVEILFADSDFCNVEQPGFDGCINGVLDLVVQVDLNPVNGGRLRALKLVAQVGVDRFGGNHVRQVSVKPQPTCQYAVEILLQFIDARARIIQRGCV